MSKFIKILSVVLVCLTLSTCLFACGGKDDGGSDIIIDDNGNVRPSPDGKETVVKFWGWGESGEKEVFERIVNEFNEKYKGSIKVRYTQRPSNNYGESLRTALLGSSGPDVVYVQDNYFKSYVTSGLLKDITSYVNESAWLKDYETTMFPNTMQRYKYNPVTTTSNDDDPIYAVPKDLAPTALYYNKDMMANVGIEIISKSEAEVKAALAEGKKVWPSGDERGLDIKIKAYYTDSQMGVKVFNNQIAMSWAECVELSRDIMAAKGNNGKYGFYSEWWFNYGWSVGGDCIEYIETDDAAYNGGYYKFTLQDASKNYIVKDDCAEGVTVNGKTYNAGEVLSYADKQLLSDEQKEKCNVLPSMREAFTEFVRLSQGSDTIVDTVKQSDLTNEYASVEDFYGASAKGQLKGYAISPNPTTIAADGKNGYFTSGKVGLLVTTMSAVKQVRANMKDDWDVAPMLVYKEYNADGTEVLVHGVQAAHSGSVGIALNAKTTKANAAFLFASYIASEYGQSIQADEGFAIPLQKSLANSDVYLKPDQKPANIKVFIDACYYETPGDWWYLRDKKWIDDWASLLNGDVRNAKITLSDFYASTEFKKTQGILNDYTKKK